MYNDVYSVTPDAKLFSTRGLYDEANVNQPIECMYHRLNYQWNIDNWSVFKPADFIDVDYQYGEITNIRGIFNRLYFGRIMLWSIICNERSLIQDNNVG